MQFGLLTFPTLLPCDPWQPCVPPGVCKTSGQGTDTECRRQSLRQLLKKGWICEAERGEERLGDTGPPRTHRPLQDVSMAARQVARQWEGAEDLAWARLVAGQEIPRRQRCWVQGSVTPKLPTCPLPTPAHPAPHLHMVPAAPAGVWQGDCDVAALLGGFLCGLQGGGTVRPRPRLGCALGAPFLGRRAAGPAPGGVAVLRTAYPGPRHTPGPPGIKG